MKTSHFTLGQKHFFFHSFRSLESQNGIDSTENLANSKIFIVHGTKDEVVDPEYAPKVVAYYKKFAVSSSQVSSKLNFFLNASKILLIFNNIFFRFLIEFIKCFKKILLIFKITHSETWTPLF